MKYWTDTITLTTGCTKVSPACLHCWAEINHNRFLRHANKMYDHDFSEVRVHPENIEKLQKKGKSKVFAVWNDACHVAVDFKTLDSLFTAALGSPHTLLICTKRIERMVEYLNKYQPIKRPIENVFLGTTVENQEMADWRIPELLKCSPFKLFLSIEPMLEKIHLPYWHKAHISYVIAGCESGPHARPTELNWLEDLKHQCIAAGVPMWVKQIKINGKMVYDHPLSTIKREDLWK